MAQQVKDLHCPAGARVQSLAQELPHAIGMAKKQNNNNNNNNKMIHMEKAQKSISVSNEGTAAPPISSD